ncbi:TPT-domain-containing protein [Mycena amicta]|nr:TPT-domain-containing protein [Mycena amicta]
MSSSENDKVESASLTKDEDGPSASLPTPVSASSSAASKPKPKIPAFVIIPLWMALSVSVILYNNHLYNTLDFRFPVFLVTWHLTFSTIGTRVLQRTTNLLDGTKDINMNKDMFLRSILPISVLFSGSLILSNSAYLHLSISYIQMLKAFNAVAVLLISWAFRISEPNKKLGLIVFMISFGVALTSSGEARFNLLGFVIQAAAVVFEASRLVMIEILLHGMKMDPLVSLHYYAPICALINLLFLPFTEGLAPFYQLARLGPLILLSNAFIAFFLNVAAVFLIGVTSGLVLTLAGVLKDILLIAGSVLLFSANVSPLQIFGTLIPFVSGSALTAV